MVIIGLLIVRCENANINKVVDARCVLDVYKGTLLDSYTNTSSLFSHNILFITCTQNIIFDFFNLLIV